MQKREVSYAGSPLWVESSRTADGVLITVEGELDLATAQELDERLFRLIRESPGATIRLDLSGVAFVDLSGWQPVLQAGATLRQDEGHLEIVAYSRPVERLLELVGVSEDVDLAEKAAGPES